MKIKVDSNVLSEVVYSGGRRCPCFTITSLPAELLVRFVTDRPRRPGPRSPVDPLPRKVAIDRHAITTIVSLNTKKKYLVKRREAQLAPGTCGN